MTKVRGVTGGGILGNKASHVNARKAEPVAHPVSMNRPSQIGLSHYFNPPPIYNKVTASTPVGPNHNFEVGPGAGREVMRSGTQAHHGPDRPMPKGRDLFK